jgi:methylated-DNA-[protein]-cysteine S-methyltransferase
MGSLDENPYGTTQSYKDLAETDRQARFCRAVGRALSENPVPILVPCHRVVSADGSLGGFLGGLTAKRYLLRLEAEGIKS